MELNALLGNTENQKCFHCEAEEVESVSINNAIFLCRMCASSHKNLGTFYSRTVPIDKKLWQHDMDILLLGGNRLLKDFLKDFEFKKDSIKDVMTSKAADFYRRMIRATADNKNFEETKPNPKDGVKTMKKPGRIKRFFNRSRSLKAESSRISSTRTSSNLSQTFAGLCNSSSQSVLSNLSLTTSDSEAARCHTDRDSGDYRYHVVKTLTPSKSCDFEGYI